MKFYYVYILSSCVCPDRHYIGMAEDIDVRLKRHSAGQCEHTSKFTPWKIKTSIAFCSKEKTIAFEKYLESHSGRAFAKKHF